MARYCASIMDADSGSEGVYEFDAEDGLMDTTPVRVVRKFMEFTDRKLITHQHIDYELNAAFKSERRRVVTAMGSLILEHEPPIPFLLMITPAKAE